jgi:hypothetical protein
MGNEANTSEELTWWEQVEQWREVDGFPCYFVSNQGRVTCKSPGAPGVLIQAAQDKDGYLQLALHRDGKQYMRFVARLVATAWIPNPANKPEVNHKDGNKADNSPSNLEWSTRSEKTKHAVRTGLVTHLSKKRKRITPAKASRIRSLAADGVSNRAIARITGIARSTVISWLHKNPPAKEPQATPEAA